MRSLRRDAARTQVVTIARPVVLRARVVLILALAIAMTAPGLASADAGTTLLGARSIQRSVGSQPADSAVAFSFRSTTSGTARSISVYIDRRNRAKNVRVGLYDSDGSQPGALTAQSKRVSAKRSGWKTLSIPPSSIVAGSRYWIAIRGSGGRLYFRDRSSRSTCKSKTAKKTSRASFPSTWRTAETRRTCALSAYVSGTAPVTATAPPAATCDRTADSAASLSSEFLAASAGQTICLATGDYGAFTGASKPGAVTIRSQDGATATMAVHFNGVSNITLDALTIKDLHFDKAVRRVTVRNSRFTGFAYIDAADMRDAAILFDANTHIDINMPNERVPPGRVHIDGDETNPGGSSGIVVRNSLFKGGTSDGIRVDAGASATIESNEFTTIKDVDPYHADPIQFNGGRNVVIRANYFHDQAESASCSLGQHDGGGGNLIERNVVVGGNCYSGMYLRADRSSVVRHNTFVFSTGACLNGTLCGLIRIDGKTAGGSGSMFESNIFGGIENTGGQPSQFTARNNLTRQRVAGTANITGTPQFTGGANPTSYDGYRLAPGSPGKNAAPDGTDIGI